MKAQFKVRKKRGVIEIINKRTGKVVSSGSDARMMREEKARLEKEAALISAQ